MVFYPSENLITGASIGLLAEGDENGSAWNLSFSGPQGNNGLFSDFAYSVDVDDNGTIYFVGKISNLSITHDGDAHWWIKKFDTNGNETVGNGETTFWNKTVAGGVVPGDSTTSDKTTATDVIVENGTGNIYVVGRLHNLTGNSAIDWGIKKYHENGTEFSISDGWNKTYNLSNDAFGAEAITIDSEGNVTVIGTITEGLDKKAHIKKFNSSGYEFTISEGWNKTLWAGGISSSFGYNIAVDSEDNIIATLGDINDSSSGTSSWLTYKFNSSGVYEWNQTWYANKSSTDVPYAVAIDSNDNIYVGGYANNYTGATGNDDVWVLKKYYKNGTEYTTSDGWNKTYNKGGQETNDRLRSIAIDSLDNVYASGSLNGDLSLKKFNSSGFENVTHWNKTDSSPNGYSDDTIFGLAIYENSSASTTTVYGAATGSLIDPINLEDWWLKSYEGTSLPDTQNPFVNNTTPVLNSQFTLNQSGNITISANVTDNVAVSRVFVNISYPNSTLEELELFLNNSNYYNSTFMIPNLTGNYTVLFIANDTTNNYNTSETTNFTVVDQTNPSVVDFVPLLNTKINITDSFVIAVNATDNYNLTRVFANVTYPNGTLRAYELFNDTGDRYNFTFNDTNITGIFNITFVINDSSNNYNTTNFTNLTAIDYIFPSIEDYLPLGNDSVDTGDVMTFAVNATDDFNISRAIVNITLPGGSITELELELDSDHLYDGTYTVPSTAGTYNFTFIVNDSFGNYNFSDSELNFTATLVASSSTSTGGGSGGSGGGGFSGDCTEGYSLVDGVCVKNEKDSSPKKNKDKEVIPVPEDLGSSLPNEEEKQEETENKNKQALTGAAIFDAFKKKGRDLTLLWIIIVLSSAVISTSVYFVHRRREHRHVLYISHVDGQQSFETKNVEEGTDLYTDSN